MSVVLFDVDGTLSGQSIEAQMVNTIEKISHNKNIILEIVGGGTYAKICLQIGLAIKYFKYIFSECGAIVHIDGILVQEKIFLIIAICNC